MMRSWVQAGPELVTRHAPALKRLVPRARRARAYEIFYRSLPTSGRIAITARWFRETAVHCRDGGSPLYERLLGIAAEDIESKGPCWAVMQVYDSEKAVPPAATPLAFMAGVHRVVLENPAGPLADLFPSTGGTVDLERVGPPFLEVVGEHRDRIGELLRRPVQTNEVSRSRVLAGGFLIAAEQTGLPLRILEMGASAGLNLRWDHYRYEVNGSSWGDPDSALCLRDGFAEGSPPFDLTAEVAERRGCDLQPLDPRSIDDQTTLLAHVWADQTGRLERLRGAFEVARHVDAPIDAADALSWITSQLEAPSPGLATVVFDTGVMEYMDEDVRTQVKAAIQRAGERAPADSPVAWLHSAPAGDEGGELQLTVWPGGQMRSLAYLDPYANSIRWRA